MRVHTILFMFLTLVLSTSLAGCGSQAETEVSVIGTQIAAEIYGTLTAEAEAIPSMAATPTPTNTPHPTETPTATSTQIPTLTPTPIKPRPSRTPRPTSTPTPGLLDRVPARGDYEHPFEVKEEYDRFDKTTQVKVLIEEQLHELAFSLALVGFVSPGDTPTIPNEVVFRWTGLRTCDVKMLLDNRKLISLVAEQFPPGMYDNTFDTAVPIDDFLAILNASQVDVQFCGVFEASLTAEHVNALRDMASRMRGDQDTSQQSTSHQSDPQLTTPNIVNVRSGPGTEYPTVGQSEAGQSYGITGKSSDDAWWQVKYGSGAGWIATSVASATGILGQVPVITDIPTPPVPTVPPATPTPAATPTSLPRIRSDQAANVGNWEMRVYEIKKAKAIYFYGTAEIAEGVWIIPLIELRNLGSSEIRPVDSDFDLYLQDDTGREFEYDIFSLSAVMAASWQYQTGAHFDPIPPGVMIGTSFPFDVPGDLGDVWLRVRQDPTLAIYIGNVSQIAETP